MGHIEKALEVHAPVEICYRLWSDFERFPDFMGNVESIRQQGNQDVWHWTVKGPLGKSVSWDAKVDSRRFNEAISWHSLPDADVDNSGAVTFEEVTPDMTRVHVKMAYDPPAGGFGELVADIFHNPKKMVEEDLERFKHLAEERGRPYFQEKGGKTMQPSGKDYSQTIAPGNLPFDI